MKSDRHEKSPLGSLNGYSPGLGGKRAILFLGSRSTCGTVKSAMILHSLARMRFVASDSFLCLLSVGGCALQCARMMSHTFGTVGRKWRM